MDDKVVDLALEFIQYLTQRRRIVDYISWKRIQEKRLLMRKAYIIKKNKPAFGPQAYSRIVEFLQIMNQKSLGEAKIPY